MKKIFVSLVSLSLVIACNKSDPDPTSTFNSTYQLRNVPDAKALNDASNFGIYKGVTISALGNSAAIRFDIYNYQSQPFALFYRDEKIADSLIRYKTDDIGNLIIPSQKDNSAISLNGPSSPAHFFSYKNGIGALASIGMEPLGLTENMEVRFDGNATLNAMLKEKSNNQVYCYEGSYSGVDSGRIALVINTDSVVAIRSSIWNPQFFKRMSAKVTNKSFTLVQEDDISGSTFVFEGTVVNDSCNGTWIKLANSSVINSFRTKRTL